jgi:hypothetical protein
VTPAQLNAAYAPRLAALAAPLKRKRIVNRMPFPAIEIHGWTIPLLRARWERHFGYRP